ncbi:hypothetical protein SDRG_04571 [Saprolegnia diclina VS20]|uniref:Uncharacterized protein n=1 Tax=Saprolegnia diclina (strain VS20) TaxID=1156394 RepID=T0QTV3_SAPDV|nr:hypothetical protein SDRG_04571 [Saprolegnia diclina VS20]EQC38141.1 hypothetical protein SDRG_04571 [Saprolegnia diclina VS20]|eukprot:XP_008608468.1 hypothetical protein SDRG_04571 [Saprolegnia diclina VS20]
MAPLPFYLFLLLLPLAHAADSWRALSFNSSYLLVRQSSSSGLPECLARDGCVTASQIADLLPLLERSNTNVTTTTTACTTVDEPFDWCQRAASALYSCPALAESPITWSCTLQNATWSPSHMACGSRVVQGAVFNSIADCNAALRLLFLPATAADVACDMGAITPRGAACLLLNDSVGPATQTRHDDDDTSPADRLLLVAVVVALAVVAGAIGCVWRSRKVARAQHRQRHLADTVCSSCEIDDNVSSVFVRQL